MVRPREIPDARVRRDRLQRCIDLLLEHQSVLVEAMAEDFGHRPHAMSGYVDIASSVKALKHAKRHVGRWMRPERVASDFPLGLLGGRSTIRYEPKGVVGLISPWNFPVNLTFGPLAGILAAGNRCVIKPSEHTPETSRVMAQAIAAAFDKREIDVVLGGPEVGREFSSRPFDHLMFTGATAIGRHIMRAAAENLVPVTLELGGKSPAVIDDEVDLNQAAERIALGKMMNAGQVCLAPDYLLVPDRLMEPLIEALTDAVRRMYPTLRDNPDYTAIINARQYERLLGLVDDARDRGLRIVEINPADEDFSETLGGYKLPLTLIVDPSDDAAAMGEEIFGPILPLVPYRDLEDAIAKIQRQPRPLALYYFGNRRRTAERLMERVASGGVTINDVIFHVANENLPFGGLGASGMGRYHGRAGFREFSHARSVYRQTGLDVAALAGLKPPYGKRLARLLRWELRR